MTVCSVDAESNIPRVILVASSGGIHAHWIHEYRRLESTFKLMAPDFHFSIWDGQSKNHDLKNARKNPNSIIFWFIQMSRVNEELRKYPDIPILIGIFDEMTLDTPREKSKTAQSDIVCRFVPQATPSALTRATSGCTSWLKEKLGGVLLQPNRLHTHLKYTRYNDAQLLIEQRCKLDHYMVGYFRNQIRMDLQPLIPQGLHMIHVLSKRGTLASKLRQTCDDILPASFDNVLKSKLGYNVKSDDEHYVKLMSLFNQPTLSICEVIRHIKMIKTRYEDELCVDAHPHIKRLVERIEEFSNECPICCDTTTNIVMMNCCTYCVCQTCYDSFRRCAFCRQPLVSEVTIETDSNDLVVQVKKVICDTINTSTSVNNLQMKNVVLAIKSLVAHSHKRMIVMINFGYHSGRIIDDTTSFLSRATGITMEYADDLIGGKGTKFAKLKARFDDMTNNEPMALICNNVSTSGVLVGVNFDKVDAAVVVGNIDETIFTQLLGRIFRPNYLRDNSKWIPLVKVYSK
tara:strand:- start:1123 stop:2670 length:1548 start_codon:yes stop_codon:yes gene_type:complete